MLLVDDNEDALILTSALLCHAGATVLVAGSARAALEVLGAGIPSVLVSDLSMPEEDGYDLVRAMRALGPVHARLPAIALSAFDSVEERERTDRAGFHDHLTKPLDMQRLVEAIEKACAAVARGEGMSTSAGRSRSGRTRGHSP